MALKVIRLGRRAALAAVIAAVIAVAAWLDGVPLARAAGYSSNCPNAPTGQLPDGEWSGDFQGFVSGENAAEKTRATEILGGHVKVKVASGKVESLEGDVKNSFGVGVSAQVFVAGLDNTATGDLELESGDGSSFTARGTLSGGAQLGAHGVQGEHVDLNLGGASGEITLRFVVEGVTCRSISGVVRDGPDVQTAAGLRAKGLTVFRNAPRFTLVSERADKLTEAEQKIRQRMNEAAPGIVQRREVIMGRWARVLLDEIDGSTQWNDGEKDCLRRTWLDEARMRATDMIRQDIAELKAHEANSEDVAWFSERASRMLTVARGLCLMGAEDCTPDLQEMIFGGISQFANRLVDDAIAKAHPADALRWARAIALLGTVAPAERDRAMEYVCNYARSARDNTLGELRAMLARHEDPSSDYHRYVLRRAWAADRETALVCATNSDPLVIQWCQQNPEQCR